MPDVEVSIIIVNWNSRDYLQKCISSVIERTQAVTYEIVVIDAASYDGSAAMLRDSFPQATASRRWRRQSYGLRSLPVDCPWRSRL